MTFPFSAFVSGGQSGVDRAALDVAIACGIAHGGWCPAGRKAEDGPIALRYRLRETPSQDYRQRTRWNVRDSDGTLIFVSTLLAGGTLYTWNYALQCNRPVMIVDLDKPSDPVDVLLWGEANDVKVLNIAGPRASSEPALYERVVAYLNALYRLR